MAEQGIRRGGRMMRTGGEVALARLRPRFRRGTRWVVRASLDARDALTGRRDPLVPPRRLGLASQLPGPGRRFVAVGLLDAGSLRPGDRVLDIGCGPGRIAADLTRHLPRGSYEGFDVVPESIAWCRRRITPRHPAFRFTLVDVDNPRCGRAAAGFGFPYLDDDFDLAFAVSVFTHLRPTESEAYLREEARVLRPGGRLVSTFFLLNEESETLSRRRPEHESPLYGAGPRSFEHELRDASGHRFRTSSPGLPEHRIGLEEDDALALHDAAGLDVVEVARALAGAPASTGRLGHDLVVAVAR
jgi:SAM-dependent methyltransferase